MHGVTGVPIIKEANMRSTYLLEEVKSITLAARLCQQADPQGKVARPGRDQR
jgi:hypothetical protein